QALRRGADVDLEDLFHGALQPLFQTAERSRPGFGVLAHPPVVDEPDRDRVQKMQLLAPSPPRDYQACLFELLQVLHHAKASHRTTCLERVQRLPVLTEELVGEAPTSGVGEVFEHVVHPDSIRDCLVTYRPIVRAPPSIVTGHYDPIGVLATRPVVAGPPQLSDVRGECSG